MDKITVDNYEKIHNDMGAEDGKNICLFDLCQSHGIRTRKAYRSIWIGKATLEFSGTHIGVYIEEYDGHLQKTLGWDKQFPSKVYSVLNKVIDADANMVEIVWYSGFDHHVYDVLTVDGDSII